MKHFILTILVVLTFIVYTPRSQALFGHVAAERNRRVEAEQKLARQQHTNSQLHVVISVLAAGVTVALIIGAAVGSKTRREAPQP